MMGSCLVEDAGVMVGDVLGLVIAAPHVMRLYPRDVVSLGLCSQEVSRVVGEAGVSTVTPPVSSLQERFSSGAQPAADGVMCCDEVRGVALRR